MPGSFEKVEISLPPIYLEQMTTCENRADSGPCRRSPSSGMNKPVQAPPNRLPSVHNPLLLREAGARHSPEVCSKDSLKLKAFSCSLKHFLERLLLPPEGQRTTRVPVRSFCFCVCNHPLTFLASPTPLWEQRLFCD